MSTVIAVEPPTSNSEIPKHTVLEENPSKCSLGLFTLMFSLATVVTIVFGILLYLIFHQKETVKFSLAIGYGLAFIAGLMLMCGLCGYKCVKRSRQSVTPI